MSLGCFLLGRLLLMEGEKSGSAAKNRLLLEAGSGLSLA
jgi:hypothetical protein